MATNIPATTSVSYCKKCSVDHERPVGNKYERKTVSKEEKRDSSKDSVKKTPRSKSSVEPSEKIYEMMMSTMSSFTDKLSAMETRISGLASRLDEPNLAQRSTGRKSRSHSKKGNLKKMMVTPLLPQHEISSKHRMVAFFKRLLLIQQSC